MKKYLAALSATALITIAPYALASSVDLTVTGTITPAACVPSISDGGMFDLGKINAKDLNPTTWTFFSKPMELTVVCEAPAVFALHSIDNKPGTAADNRTFGLGLTVANEKIGAFSARIKTVQADGVAARAIDSIDNGTTWAAAAYTYPDRLISTSATGSLVPIPVENLVMSVDTNVWIARADSLTLTDEVNFDGSATFEVKYL